MTTVAMEAPEANETIESLSTELEAMKTATEKKMAQGVESFISQTDIASEKFKMVSGYLNALDAVNTMDWAELPKDTAQRLAIELAKEMSDFLKQVKTAFESEAKGGDEFFKKLPTFLSDHGWVTKDFIDNAHGKTIADFAREYLRLQALSNMAGMLDEMGQFYLHAVSEAEKIQEKIAELEEK